MMVNQDPEQASAPRKEWRYLGLVLSVVALLVAMGAAVFAATANNRINRTSATVEANQPPQWWRTMYQLQQADHWPVYDCARREMYPVPCPDYVATIKFTGNKETQRPILTPARDAKGNVVIDLKASWHSTGCGTPPDPNGCREEGWDVRPVFAESALAFGYNQKADVSWDGIRMFTPQLATFTSGLYPNGTVEVYAGDLYSQNLGTPLTPDRLGRN